MRFPFCGADGTVDLLPDGCECVAAERTTDSAASWRLFGALESQGEGDIGSGSALRSFGIAWDRSLGPTFPQIPPKILP